MQQLAPAKVRNQEDVEASYFQGRSQDNLSEAKARELRNDSRIEAYEDNRVQSSCRSRVDHAPGQRGH